MVWQRNNLRAGDLAMLPETERHIRLDALFRAFPELDEAKWPADDIRIRLHQKTMRQAYGCIKIWWIPLRS
jgi:hypothetical protein